MQKKKSIIAEHKKILSLIKKYNKNYYIDDSPKVSDAEFDKIKKNALELEQKYSYLKNYDSVQNIIGSKPLNKFKKIEHLSPMLSLSNAFNLEDMSDFQKKINNFLSYDKKEVQLFCEPKIDGISATLIYEKGILIKGLSRGDGYTGEDILENLKTVKNLPKKINFLNVPSLLEIRCEVYISKKDFAVISNKFANPRNAAGGSLRQKDPLETSKIPLTCLK